MGKEFIFHVILNFSRHDDERLANQKQEETPKQSHNQNQNPKNKDRL